MLGQERKVHIDAVSMYGMKLSTLECDCCNVTAAAQHINRKTGYNRMHHSGSPTLTSKLRC
jgi:hypothetical protein